MQATASLDARCHGGLLFLLICYCGYGFKLWCNLFGLKKSRNGLRFEEFPTWFAVCIVEGHLASVDLR